MGYKPQILTIHVDLINLQCVDEFVAEFCGGLAIHLFCEKASLSLSPKRWNGSVRLDCGGRGERR